MPSKTFAKLFYPFTTVWQFLDVLAFFLSPLAVIGVVIVGIVSLDGFGQHVQFLRAIDQHGVETVGTWSVPSSASKYAYVAFDKEVNGWSGVLVAVKYYDPETLASLKEGQRVRVRYTLPPAYEFKGVLADEYHQVKGYTGYFTELLWPFLFCWVCVVIHPDWLYLGFLDPFSAKEKKP